MAGVAYFKGQQLGPSDLDIFLENVAGIPTNAAEIHYALYDATTGQEVLLGVPKRTPANPEIGKYYASLIIPLDANFGLYRIRWTFREVVGGPIHQVVQEFEVVDKSVDAASTYTDCDLETIRRLRIMLRDNCIGEEELIRVDADGELLTLTIKELYEALHGTS